MENAFGLFVLKKLPFPYSKCRAMSVKFRPILPRYRSKFLFLIQTQRSADRNGCASNGLRSQRSLPFVHSRGRVWVTERACQVSSSFGRRRRIVQFVLSLERYRRVYQHVLLVPCLRHVARRPAAKILQGRERMVERRWNMYDDFVAWARFGSCRKLEKHLKRSSQSSVNSRERTRCVRMSICENRLDLQRPRGKFYR